MPHPQARRDGYGRPLPELAEARQQVLRETKTNLARVQTLFALLEDQLQQVLRRGIYADVTLRFVVMNGVIAPEIDGGITRHLRQPFMDEDHP